MTTPQDLREKVLRAMFEARNNGEAADAAIAVVIAEFKNISQAWRLRLSRHWTADDLRAIADDIELREARVERIQTRT